MRIKDNLHKELILSIYYINSIFTVISNYADYYQRIPKAMSGRHGDTQKHGQLHLTVEAETGVICLQGKGHRGFPALTRS